MIQRFTRQLILLACVGACSLCLALAPGDQAPAVSLPLLNGQGEASLAQLRGKVVYIDFWASWCGPCRVSLPAMEEIRVEFAGQGFEVLAINVDENPQDAKAFLQKYPVTYPVVSDASGASPRIYGVKGMPTAFLLDREGQVRYVHESFRPSDSSTIRSQVLELLGEE